MTTDEMQPMSGTFQLWDSPADELLSAIRMGRTTDDIPRSVTEPDDYAHCRACGLPGAEYEQWIVEAMNPDYSYRIPVCDACVLRYREGFVTTRAEMYR